MCRGRGKYGEEKIKKKGKERILKKRVRGRSEADGLSAEARKNGRRGEMKDGGPRWNTNWPLLVCLLYYKSGEAEEVSHAI